MRCFLGILFFIMINSDCFAQSNPERVLLSLNEIQARSVFSAIEFYKKNYSSEIYGFTAIENNSDFIFSFIEHPGQKMQRGGGGVAIEVIYSKKLLKIIKVTRVGIR
jgi:hypothetical protein